MSSKLCPCDECGLDTPREEMTDQYKVNVHTFHVELTMMLCPKCAADIEARRTHGHPEEWLVRELRDYMRPSYAATITVRWIQGDEHLALVHVRLETQSL